MLSRLRFQLLATLFLCSGTVEATEVLRPVDAPGVIEMPGVADGQLEMSCDDGTVGGALVERKDAYYGNHFTSGCSSARIEGVTFVHDGSGVQGPYLFRVHLLDGGCGSIGVSGVLEVPAAADEPQVVELDLSELGWCINEDFYLMLEPLTCTDEAEGDCYPALVVDATSDTNPHGHCATVSTESAGVRECLAARSADGRYFDFWLRAQLQCESNLCSTPLTSFPWTTLKRLYRDPSTAIR